MRLIWSAEALRDLRAIVAELESPPAATRIVRRIRLRVRRLGRFPRPGRVVREIDDPAVREVIVGNYRVVHLVMPNRVEILAVIDARRLAFPPFGVSEEVAEYTTPPSTRSESLISAS